MGVVCVRFPEHSLVCVWEVHMLQERGAYTHNELSIYRVRGQECLWEHVAVRAPQSEKRPS